jgi:hypothetical protein
MVPSVAIKELTLKITTINPFRAPQHRPATSIKVTPAGGDTFWCTMKREPTVAEKNATEPTEMSRFRVMITRANPSDRTSIGTAACIIFIMLLILKKLGVPKERQIKTNPITMAKPYESRKLCSAVC